MPYAPGIQYIGGQLLGQGIAQAAQGLTAGLERYAARKDATEQLRAQLAGPKPANALAAYAEAPESPVDFGNLGTPEGPNEGTGEGDATEREKKVHKLTKALRDIGEHGYGYSRPVVDSMGYNELLGLTRREEKLREQRQDALAQARLIQEAQHQAAQEDLALKQLALHQGQVGMQAANTLMGWGNQWADNRRADAYLGLAQKKEQDATDKLREAAKTQAAIDADVGKAWEHIARYSTAPGGVGPVLPMGAVGAEALARFPMARRDTNFDNTLKVLETFGKAPNQPMDWKAATGRPFVVHGNSIIPADPHELTADKISSTKPEADEIPDGFFAQRVANGWVVKEDPRYWKTTKDLLGQTQTKEFNADLFYQHYPEKRPQGFGAPGASPSSSGGMPSVTTKAQFDALPSGATYKGKDGNTYRKP